MSAVTNLWRQLVQRRLLPVAILLIAALVAVPLMLAKDPDPVPAPPPPQVDTKSELATTPIVSQATPQDRARRRKVLGKAKNPFAVAKKADDVTGAGEKDDAAAKTPDTGGASDTPSTGSDAPAAGAPAAPVAPTTPVEPQPEPKHYAPGELTVRFGESDGAHRRSVKRLVALPSAELPVLIYTGLTDNGKTAVFLVDSGVEAVGDGKCDPTPEQCETIHLRVGDTEFLDVKDALGTVTQQYQIDLLKIHKSSSASAARAGTSRHVASRARSRARARRSEVGSVAGRTAAFLP